MCNKRRVKKIIQSRSSSFQNRRREGKARGRDVASTVFEGGRIFIRAIVNVRVSARACSSNTFFPVYSMPSRSSSPTVLDRSTSPLPRTARRCATGFAVRTPPFFASTCVPCVRVFSFVSRSFVFAFVVSFPFCPRTPRAFRVVVRLVLDVSSRTLSLFLLVSVGSRGRILPATAFATRSALPRVSS